MRARVERLKSLFLKKMIQKIYADEIIQSFISDGNVFLKLGVNSGDINQVGEDVKDIAVCIIIPLSRFQKFAANVGLAASSYLSGQNSEEDAVVPDLEESIDMGVPLIVPE